jgi:predicted metalloprotease
VAAALALILALVGTGRAPAIPRALVEIVAGAPTVPVPMGGETATLIARKLSVVHADTQAVWRHLFRARLGRPYVAPEFVMFSRNTPTPCADAHGASGPFYCAANRFTAFDLVFFDTLAQRAAETADLGLALVVAQIAGSHVQQELAILRDVEQRRVGQGAAARRETELAVALQADCLAGIWARKAEARIGPVEPGRYGEVMTAVRTVAQELQQRGHTAPTSYNAYHLGEIAEREAAFATGYRAAELRDCLSEGLRGNLF